MQCILVLFFLNLLSLDRQNNVSCTIIMATL